MNQWHVECYSEDDGKWLEIDWNQRVYFCLDDAVKAMRSEAEDHPHIPHRVIRSVIHRSTAAMSVHGEELIK